MMTGSPDEPRGGMRVNALAYGADFNPEQWDDAYLEEDIALMTEAGVNVVTVGVFSWAVLEPEPGRFSFGWLRRVLDRLHEAGIGVDLATATASPPPWMGSLHPSTLPVTAEGVRLGWGSRQQVNPSSAVFRERVELLVGRLADEFAHHPAVVAWHVGNEFGGHAYESFDEESADRFRQWLRERYADVAALNEAWGTAFWSQRYRSFHEVIPPRAMPGLANPHLLDDWRAFSSDMLLELFLIEKRILRAANPETPITTNFMGLFGPVDYASWAPHLDFISNDSYPDPANPRAAREFAFDCDLMRSLGEGRPFVQMEQVTSGVQWRERNAAKRPGQYALWSMAAVARGADGILNFQWRQSVAGAESFHGAMWQHAGRDSRIWTEVVGLGAELAAHEELRGSRVPVRAALLWDWRNAWAQGNAVGPVADPVPENTIRAWHASLFELGVIADIVHPDRALTRYDLVVVPSLFRLTETHVRSLVQAQEAGATILVTYLTGYVDARGHAMRGGYLGALAALTGVRVADVWPHAVTPFVLGHAEPLRADVDRISAAVGTPAAGAVALQGSQGEKLAAHGWVENIVVDDPRTEIVFSFRGTDLDGSPAVTRRQPEEGGPVWYVGTDPDSRARDVILRRVLADAGISPETSLPAGVECVRRGPFDIYLNYGDAPVTVAIGLDRDEMRIEPRSAQILRHDPSERRSRPRHQRQAAEVGDLRLH